MKKEINIQNTIRLALSDAGVLTFRNNVGAYKTDAGNFVRYGVGEKGGSDLICATPVLITDDMVGKTLAVFTAIEVKTQTGRPTAIQLAFIEAIKKIGGYAGIARNVQDALEITKKGKL